MTNETASAPAPPRLAPSRICAVDAVRVATVGMRGRPLRTSLTALGIAIGIAALISVVGISTSSRADLVAQLDALGTGLLRVAPGQSIFGESATLPESARATAARIGPVTDAAALTDVGATVRRSPLVDPGVTGGIAVAAADPNLVEVTSARLAQGRSLDTSPSQVPTVVLGADAARRLGISTLEERPRVWITDANARGEWYVVIGILAPAPLAPELDSAALIGYGVAATLYTTTISPSTLFVRMPPERVEAVRAVLARSVKPAAPNEVEVSRPSDALEARARADAALRNLLLALGAVALVVGAVGITNVMVISVLERRTEIGVRRALGATRTHVAMQFVGEAILLALLGGLAGCLLGAVVTSAYATSRGWTLSIPLPVLAAGVTVALAVGALAGISPAVRAARLDPADAVRPM